MAAKDKHLQRRMADASRRRRSRPSFHHAAAVTALATALAAGSAYAQEEPAAPAATQPPVPGEVGAPPAAGPAATGPAADTAAALRQPLWLVVPSITIGETATDNVRSTSTDRQSDLVTTITPSIFASGQSTRLQGALDYSPTVLRHIEATDQDSVVQNLLGNGTLNIIPEHLFLDTNASISDQSRSGSRGFGNTSEISSNDRTQQMAYSASPYARFRLGDVAESEVRYRFSQTNFNGNTGAITSPVTGQTLSSLSDSTEQEGTASIATARDFSRLQATATADYDNTSYTNGELSSKRASGNLDLSYPITHTVYALASGGFERLTYSDEPQLNTTGPTWSVGGRYEVNDKQSVSLTYGRREGMNSFAGNARYALTPATTLSATYSKARSTTQQQILQSLLSATPTGPGSAIDASTGLPLALTNPNLPLQNDIVVAQNVEAGVTNTIGRNSFSLIGTHVDQRSLLHLSPDERSTGGFLTWGRDLSEALSSNVLVGYSTVSQDASAGAPQSTSHIVTFSASLGYKLGQGLQAGILYNLVANSGGTAGNVTTNTLTLSVTKSF
jgi:uncharacterized protein (PEP-CTERM system associated)